MLEKNESRVILEKWYSSNVRFWLRDRQSGTSDEREAHRRALEWDLVGLYKHSGCLHDPGHPLGEELDKDTCISFLKEKCMDLYGHEWIKKWPSYGIGTIHPLITKEIQERFESLCIREGVEGDEKSSNVPIICGCFGRACRNVNDFADSMLCTDCRLARFAKGGLL